MSASGHQQCSNCGAAHGPDDIFCESCGYDFITGSLPSADEARSLGLAVPAPGGPGTSEVGAAPGQPPVGVATAAGGSPPPPVVSALLQVEVAADRAYFDAVVAEGELEFPEPAPGSHHLELAGPEIHIGRTSQSRGIHPDIDLAMLTGDPAVSSSHAIIRMADDGALSVIDVGSTNGTIVGSVDAAAIPTGMSTPLSPGTPVYVGAWSRIMVTPRAT